MKGNEIKVTSFSIDGKIPSLMNFENGKPVLTKQDWFERRKELLKAVEIQFGPMPPKPDFLEVERLDFDGLQSTFKIHTGTRENPLTFLMYAFLPAGEGPFPAVIDGDMCFKYLYDYNFVHNFTDNGIVLIAFNRVELAYDLKKEPKEKWAISKTYPGQEWSSMAAWAWGYSRCLDALEILNTREEFPIHTDLSNVTFTGHSRGGKTALLAGIMDERARIVNANCSGEGGCAIHRVRMTAITEKGEEKRSETLKDIVVKFPHWFGKKLDDYQDKEAELPFDAHYLMALVAPRILLDTEAASDIWANPIGTWMANKLVQPAFDLLGVPENHIWHYRDGIHFHRHDDINLLKDLILEGPKSNKVTESSFSMPFDTTPYEKHIK